MKKILSLLMVIALTVVMLIGCSANKEATDIEAAKSNGATTKEITEVSTNTINYPYTYIDAAKREVVIEKQPMKVAVSYLPHWETLMMLDVMPIATTSAKHYAATWDPFKGMDLSSVVDLGETDVNLELLAGLKPDIILEQAYDISKVDVENFEKIAPVAVFGEEVKMDWRYSLREIGKVVGKSQRAEEVITQVDKKLEDARLKLDAGYKDKTVMMMSLMGKDRYFCAYRPDLYDEQTGLGLNIPASFPRKETYTQVSMEAMVEMNPDYIFVNVFDGNEALIEELSNNSVWKSLKAVKAGHVYVLDGSGHACSAISTVYTIDFIVDKLLSNQ